MRRGPRVRVAALAGLLTSIALAGLAGGSDATARAADPCRLEFGMLGQMPGLIGPTPTDWFNVVGDGFNPNEPVVLTFDVPVIPLPVDPAVGNVQPVLQFRIPPGAMGASFKWTFRALNRLTRRVQVEAAGAGCNPTLIFDLAQPGGVDLPSGMPPADVAIASSDADAGPGAGPTAGPDPVVAGAFGAAVVLLVILAVAGVGMRRRRRGARQGR